MIRSLLHVGMTVPDLEVGRAFYDMFGLQTRVSGNDLLFNCEHRDQEQLRLIEGPKKKLGYVSLGTDAPGLKGILVNLQKAGVPVLDSPFAKDIDGIWFQDPDGDWVNVQIAEAAPSLMPPAADINAPGRYRRIGERAADLGSLQKKARPRRLGHLIKFSTDVNRAVDFYTRVLGMRLTDRSGDIIAFVRGCAGGDHHIMAFAKSSHTGLHHVSFEVGDVDEIEIGAQTLLRAGYKDGWGLGRHLGGSNYFHYIRDPWDSLAEYFWDIDIIPEDDSDWHPMDIGIEQISAVWATTPPPPEFPMNFEPV